MSDSAPSLIRAAIAADASEITALLAELGYPDEVVNVSGRLERLSDRSDAGVLVAVLGGNVGGLAAYQVIDLLERAASLCRITALVVGERERRHGVARGLIAAIESIAADRGCFALEVTTRPHRLAASDFYLAVGFEERPRRLIKTLART